MAFSAQEFHSKAWVDPLGATSVAKQSAQGSYHLDNKCDECSWIAIFHLRGLIKENNAQAVRDHS